MTSSAAFCYAKGMVTVKRIALWGFAVVAIIGLLHFVPISREQGVLNTGSTTCIGYTSPRQYDYRMITGDLDGYNEDRRRLASSQANSPCGEPVDLRLYVW